MKQYQSLILLILFLMAIGFTAFPATPEIPYPDLSDGDTLTPTHYNGMLHTLYEWAQGNHASVTQLLSGSGLTGTLTASATASTASGAMPLIWDSLNSPALAMGGSGTLSFMTFCQATSHDGQNLGNFYLNGSMYSNGSASAIMDTPFFTYNSIGSLSDSWNLIASVTTPGHLYYYASTTASVTWTLQTVNFEGHY